MGEVHCNPFRFAADSLSVEIETVCVACMDDGNNFALQLFNSDGKAVTAIFPLAVAQLFQEPVDDSSFTGTANCSSAAYHDPRIVRFWGFFELAKFRLAGGFFADENGFGRAAGDLDSGGGWLGAVGSLTAFHCLARSSSNVSRGIHGLSSYPLDRRGQRRRW
jgi:hypothetical protein